VRSLTSKGRNDAPRKRWPMICRQVAKEKKEKKAVKQQKKNDAVALVEIRLRRRI
jgi:hypothetical protein